MAVDRPYHHGDLQQTLIAAALALLTEQQDWTFSLREVARRAGVSHNAPYHHFADKHELLIAVAANGFLTLRRQMLAAIEEVDDPRAALLKSGEVFVTFGARNPALYRLMFGPVFATARHDRKGPLDSAAAEARAVLNDIIRRGAVRGTFTPSPTDEEALQLAALAAMSLVHGMTMLVIDGLATGVPHLPVEDIVERLGRLLCDGLVRPGT